MPIGNMTEDEVFEAYANGLPENFQPDFSKARKNRFLKSDSDTVQISLKIEGDLLERLKRVAEEKGLGYQTLLKQLVRAGLDAESKTIEPSTVQSQLEANMRTAVQALVNAAVLAAKGEAA